MSPLSFPSDRDHAGTISLAYIPSLRIQSSVEVAALRRFLFFLFLSVLLTGATGTWSTLNESAGSI